MSYQQIFVRTLADILLIDDWQVDAMVDRVYWLIDSKPNWVKPLVIKLHTHFNKNTSGITKQEIIDFVVHKSEFSILWQQQRHQLRIRQFNLKQIPTLTTLKCDLPSLQNLNTLSSWLALSQNQLANYANNWRVNDPATQSYHRHYHYHWIKKKNGQKRLIEAPKQRMANVQRQIYLGILNHIPLHKSCHGFRKQHSCLSYAEPHTGKHVVIHMDLENFFTSIPIRRVHAIFTAIGLSESVARSLAGLCCEQTPREVILQNPQLNWQQQKQLMASHLPQGSPSSPVIANLCAYRLDLRLSSLAEKLGGTYTRYADDLAFSGDVIFAKQARQLITLVAHIAIIEGFSVNHRKTRIMHQGVSQKLTGMTLNKFANFPRKDYDKLKAILHNCVKFGHQSQNRNKLPNFKSHLQGKIAYVRSLNPEKADKLEMTFSKINW
ncbi:MAG: reverse transcriptase family protein [Methylophagaceae bacterium]